MTLAKEATEPSDLTIRDEVIYGEKHGRNDGKF
jgi:hypothetical protein